MVRALRAFTSPFTLLLVLILLGYAFYFRATLPTTGAPLGTAEVSALFATDPYYLFYAVIPAWTIFALRSVRENVAFAVIVRSRTTTRWVRRCLTSTTQQLWPLLVLLIAIWLIAGLGYQRSWQWLRLPYSSEESLYSPAIVQTGLSPAGLAAATLLVLIIAASTTYILFATVTVLTGRLASAVVLALVFVVDTIVSHNVSHRGLLQLIAFENYLSPVSAQTAFGTWWAGSLISLIAAGAALAALRIRDRRTVRAQVGARTRTAISVAVPLALVAIAGALNAATSDSVTTISRTVFQGAGINGGTNLIALLFAAVVFLLPAFLHAGRLENELEGRLQYVLIRSHSFTRWVAQELARHIAFVALYLAGLAIVLIASWSAARVTAGQRIAAPTDVGQTIYQFGVNGTLQLLFYWALTTLLVLITGRAFTGLIGLAAVIVLAITAVGPLLVFLPLFANSLSHLAYGWPGLFNSTLVLVIGIAACLVAGILTVNRRGLVAH